MDALGASATDVGGEGATAAYVRARTSESVEDWVRFFNVTPVRDPFHLLAYARAVEDAGQAALILRRALEQRPPYSFYPRAGKLVDRLAKASETHLRECRIAVLGTSTTALLIPVLKAFCLRDRIRAEVYEGLYGSLTQEILDPGSGLARFRPSIVFLVGCWRDLQLPPVIEDESVFVRGVVERQKALWDRLAGDFACHVVQFGFDFPAEEAHGYLAGAMTGGRSRVIELVNRALVEAAGSQVSVLDAVGVQRQAGATLWSDSGQWYSFQQHPATEALPLLADAMLAHCRAVLGLTKKVLVTDLDNTLWKGVIGEDGLDGIEIGPGSPAGEAHSRLQQYLLDLKARGILLAVASKNNHDDACLPFHKHPRMLLRMEDFAAFEANWNDKASSIREIARKLSLGTDSFVFLDDNPMEREWVRSQLPEVAVVELGPSAFDYTRELDRGQYFFALSLSAEDKMRADQYRSEAARKHLQASSQSIEEFLAQLHLRPSWEPVSEKNLPRVAQLTNKTNQFNLTTRRYTEAQVRQLAGDPECWAAAFHLSDRMGDYGLIGVIFCRPGAVRASWVVDTWLMSCRVLGRRMERFMFEVMSGEARRRGVTEISGVYRPTPKNGLVRDHYDQLGFARVESSAEETRYRLELQQDLGSEALGECALSSQA